MSPERQLVEDIGSSLAVFCVLFGALQPWVFLGVPLGIAMVIGSHIGNWRRR